MKKIYLYLPDNMAEWEVVNFLQVMKMKEIEGKRRKDVEVVYLGRSLNKIETYGGFEKRVEVTEIDYANAIALLLPGSDRWSEDNKVEAIVKECYDRGILIASICGSTLLLATMGLFDKHRHTSNSVDYLKYFVEGYKSEEKYVEELAYRDENIISASSAGALQWAKEILLYLEIYPKEVIESWYAYFSTGNPKYYMELIS